MTFLNPLLLIGLAAAAIPILVHLFNFRRPRRVVFSSLAFLRELEKTTMQRMRLQQWLLLALRILALACLALAFARPVLEGVAGDALGRARASVALVVDNSPSMRFRDAQGAYFDQAKALAASIAEGLEDGDQLYLVPTASGAAPAPEAFRSKAALLDALDRLEVGSGTQPLTRAVDRAAALLEDATFPVREVYVVSDFQASTFSDSARTPVPFEGRVVLLPVGGRAQPNVAVTRVEVVSRIVEAGQPVTLEATLVNYGSTPLTDYGADVVLEERPVAQNAVTLPPGVPTTVRFTFTPDARGWLGGRVETEADGFEDDNARAFTLYVPETRRVLVVRGVGTSTRYLELALSPALVEGQGTFAVTAIPEDQLAATSLSAFDAVVLAAPASLASGEVQALAQFVEGGGGVLAYPSDDPAALNALLAATGGGSLAPPVGEGGRVVATFGRVDREHPVFAGVFDRAGGAVEQPDVYRYAPYRPAGGAQATLIGLAGGGSFVQEIRHGRGALLLFTSALDGRWSDLPTRGLFVPLMHRSVFYLTSPAADPTRESLAGQPLRLQVGGRVGGQQPVLTGPEGEQHVVEARTLFGSTLLETADALEIPGLYTLEADGQLLRRVAVNLDARESAPEALQADAAGDALARMTGLEARVVRPGEAPAERVREALQSGTGGREIWNILLGVALLFLAAEMLVSSRRRPAPVPV